MKRINARTVVALGGASCVLVGGLTGLPTPFLVDLVISAPLALVTGLGIFKFFPSKDQNDTNTSELHKLIEQACLQAGVSPKDVADAITLGNAKIEQIRTHANRIKNPNTKRRIERICKVSQDIVDGFKKDPKDVRTARTWLNTHLDQTINLVQSYANLSESGTRSIAAQNEMVKFDHMLDLIEKSFKDLLKKMLNNDILDFDVELTVFRNSLENEGI